MVRKLLIGVAATGILAVAMLAPVATVARAASLSVEYDPPNYQPGEEDATQWGLMRQQAPVDEPDAPPVQAGTIESIKFEENPGLNGGFLFIPPDPHCAVGPNHLLTIVNCGIQWYLKTGGAAQNQQPLGKQAATVTNSFFNSLNPANGLFDPRVIYDQYDNRFIVCADEQVITSGVLVSSRMLFAVSDDADPNGTWYFFAMNTMINVGGINYWLDYPGIACDQNVVYLTGNFFPASGNGIGSRFFIINKAPWYAGGAATFNPGNPFDAASLAAPIPPNTGTAFNSTMMPTQMFGTPPAGVGTWLVMYSGLSDGNEYLQTIRVDNPTGVPSFNFDIMPMGNIDNTSVGVPRGPQPTSTATIATQIDNGDRRTQNALWRNGNLYCAFHVNPVAAPDANQCTAHWVKTGITNNVGTLADQGNVGGENVVAGAFTDYPSVAVDKLGNMAIGCGVGASTVFTSAAYTTRSFGDPAGFTNPLVVYANGNAFYRRTFSSSASARNRWGDYTGTVVDPASCQFWSYNEYAGTQGTATTVGTVTENGRWWTRAVNYYVDDNANGFPDGCEPVAVVLSKLEAVRDGAAAVIRWTVVEENDHLGFNVFRETEGGARMMIHNGLITGTTDYEIRDDDAPAGAVNYWLQEVDREGTAHWIGSVSLAPMNALPVAAQLIGASPNPFSASTSVQYTLGTARSVNLSVYDIQGRKVATLVDGVQAEGSHSVSWDGRTLNGSSATSGFYFVKLQTAGIIKNIKIVLNRGTESAGTSR